MTAPLSAPETSFSEQLRAATWSDHQDAEGDGFVRGLVEGALPLAAYADLAAQHWAIYAELEAISERHRDDPVAGELIHDELLRHPSLEEDLTALVGPGWAAEIEVLPATAQYVERLREVAGPWPGGFVAHHYTRYLGDLSGGLFIGRAVDRIYGFGGGPGARFYAFDEIADPRSFKDGYRATLDAAPWPDDERARVIDEVKAAYRCNQAVFADLAARHGL
jgi:heme oxygenase (biliverdin-producing, ferredoxin)